MHEIANVDKKEPQTYHRVTYGDIFLKNYEHNIEHKILQIKSRGTQKVDKITSNIVLTADIKNAFFLKQNPVII